VRELAAVLADPWADGPRERFADAVESSDPDRARFVRAQLDIARARRAAAVRRKNIESDALGASLPGLRHGLRWNNGIAPLLAGGTWRFRRGFVEEVTLPAAHFLKVAPSIAARVPLLDVVLTQVRPVATALFASPHLARLRSLDLADNGLGDAEIVSLAESRHLGKLRWLSLYFNRVTDAGVDRLAAARDTLPALRFVRLDANPCADPNPVPEEEDGRVYGLSRSVVEDELRARHGAVPWLGDNPSADPPDPETFA
jgi:hypothetical protein